VTSVSVYDILIVSISCPVESAITNVQIQSYAMHKQDGLNRFYTRRGRVDSSQEHEESAGGASGMTSVPSSHYIAYTHMYISSKVCITNTLIPCCKHGSIC
jgi:hypothetical protein